MILYTILCPVHHTEIVTDDKHLVTVKYQKEGKKEVPVFFCPTCKRYYLYTAVSGTNPRDAKKKYKEYPVFFTTNKYISSRDGAPKPSKSRFNNHDSIRKKPAGIGNNGGNKNGNKDGGKNKKENRTSGSPFNLNENGEKVIRIHELKKEDIDTKLRTNFNSVRTAYPQLITEQMTVHDLLSKVFPGNMKQRVVVRNETFMGNQGNLIRRVEIYNKNSSYLKHRLPEGIYLSFGGRVTNGEFYVNEIRLLEKPILKADDIEADVVLLYDGPNHTNWLYNITANVAKHAEQLEGELADWNEYLDWKRQLAELRIRGMKYIGFRLDVEEREITFLVVTEGKQAFDDFKRYLRRNEVSVFSNNYSNDRWSFEFNREYQDNGNNDSGIPLTFVRCGNNYNINDVDNYIWDEIRGNTKKYKDETEGSSTRFLLGGIVRTYSEPYVSEIVFEFSLNAMTAIDRQLRSYGELSENIKETLAEEFYSDGYIATSQIGDFALLKRLKQSVYDLANGKAASHGLDQWLFDITKAREPEKIEHIQYWQNTSINNRQKQAVEKILSVPDVCLIQGPPGTGKTTVIAEAIYQLVSRDKRVLVASQANLAVDNALERLISNPKIRAIRLGKVKKIDSSVSNITEGNVLETFYDSILQYIDEQYVKKWDHIDSIKRTGEHDYKCYLNARNVRQTIASQIQSKQVELDQLGIDWDNNTEYEKQNAMLGEKANLILLQSFCQGNTDDLELMLCKDSILSIWAAIEPILMSIKRQGLYLTKVGVDTTDLDKPQRISDANKIIKYILKNIKLASKLMVKLNSMEQFGGDSRELEELKIQEQILKEKVLKEMKPEDMVVWQAINKKIEEVSESGMGITPEEQKLFDEKTFPKDSAECKEYMLNILNAAFPAFQMLFQELKSAVTIRLEAIAEKQQAFAEKSRESEVLKENLKKEIEDLQLEDQRNQKIVETTLRKYKATHENLQQIIEEYGNKVEIETKVTIERGDWEDIFQGLKQWVADIPDYSQEKEVYLKDFINGCNVVGVSCTESARTLSENGFDDFDVVIIDEVSKATPPELLIPMIRGRKIVLVGDHRQLPPLFNEHEKTYQEVAEQQEGMEDMIVSLTMEDFEKYKDMVTSSLFERYFENARTAIKETLIYQYRMHFDIMDIINIFYDKCLKDGNEDNYTYDTKAHYLSIQSVFGTEMIIPDRHAYWFDSSELAGQKIYEQRKLGSTSAENLVEAELIMELLKKIELQYVNRTERTTRVTVGIISFYYDQVTLIRQMLRSMNFHAIDVEVNTVDRFQGKEKEIIFVSLVRNTRKTTYNVDSHIAAFQRINVAFSRAQNLLIIVGAKDMYVDQPVKLTDMNNGEEKVIMAYRNIIEMLDQKGTYFTSDEVITDIKADEIIQRLKRSEGGGTEA